MEKRGQEASRLSTTALPGHSGIDAAVWKNTKLIDEGYPTSGLHAYAGEKATYEITRLLDTLKTHADALHSL